MKQPIVVGILLAIVCVGAVTFGSRFLHSAPSLADCVRDTYDDLRCDAYVRATFAHDMPRPSSTDALGATLPRPNPMPTLVERSATASEAWVAGFAWALYDVRAEHFHWDDLRLSDGRLVPLADKPTCQTTNPCSWLNADADIPKPRKDQITIYVFTYPYYSPPPNDRHSTAMFPRGSTVRR